MSLTALLRAGPHLALFLTLAGYATAQAAETDSATQPAAMEADEPPAEAESNYPPQSLTPDMLFGALVGDIALQRGQRQLAANTWLKLAQDNKDPRVAKRALEVALSAGLLNSSLQAAVLWRELEPASASARQSLVGLYIEANRPAEAAQELKALFDLKTQEVPQYFMQLHTLWTPQMDKGQILKLTEGLAANYPTMPEARLAVAVAARSDNKGDVAMAAIDEALRLKPDWQPAIIYRAGLLQVKSSDAAVDYLRDAAKRYPKAREVRLALAKELTALRRYDEARLAYAALSHDFPQEGDFLIGEALNALQIRNFAAAENALRRALATNPKEPGALFYYLGVTAEEQLKPDQAIASYRNVTGEDYRTQARTRLARLLARQGDQKGALEAVALLPASTETETVARILLEAQVWRELKDLAHARQILDKGLKQFVDQPDLLYDRSMIFETNGQIKEAEQDLRRYLAKKPDSATGLNALGYTLANRTERFDEAETLIRKALDKEPDNPVIVDSYGWLQFRRGNVDEAVKWLSRAFTELPDPEVAAHYGEALWRAGKQEEAKKIWAEGSRLDPKHEVLIETVRRLTGK